LVAQLAPGGNGIQLIDNSLGSGTLTVTDANQSTAANSLGLIPAGAASATAAAPGAAATASVDFPASNTQLDFQAKGQGTSLDGTQISFVDTGLGAGSETFSYDPTAKTMVFGIDPATTTASTVISLLEADPTANAAFSVTLDPSGDTTGNGLVAPATASVGGGQAEVLTGSDANPLQAGGVFTALVRLQTALQQDDTAGIESASNLLTSATTQVSAARAELGVRSQGLAAMQTRETNNALTLQTNLSNVEDVDFAQATSDFSAEQTDYEASLKTTAAIFQMSLFNYL
jgi:flagellin-like hook-associated protein FlgL